MICNTCGNHLTLCICDDIDERIKQLESSPFLSMDWEGLKAARFLNKFEIEKLKKESKKLHE